jgi:predicted alpha/beta superfamily hydrolase
MKKLYFAFVLLLFSLSSCLNSPPPPKGVVFQVYSPDLPDTTSVFITGSIEALGNWNPSAIKMKALKNHRWQYCIQGKTPPLIAYKFTLGSWEREASGANGLPFQNFILKPKGDTLVEHSIYFWLDGVKKVFQGKVTGHVDYPGKMKYKGLIDREVIVWLPPEYQENPTKRFPVLYMHDGQNLFNPATSSFGVDWQLDESLDSLAKTGTCDIPIVVGIYNTAERTADYTIGKQSDAYMKFVVDSVKTFVDKNYRTLADAQHTAVGGSSYGGLISFRMAWEYPQVFSKAFCLSPALKIQNINYVQHVLNYDGPRKNLKFYIDNGGVGLEEQLLPGIKEMLAALKKKGYKQNKDYFWVYDKKARHFESDWAKRMPHALELMYTKKKTNEGK